MFQRIQCMCNDGLHYKTEIMYIPRTPVCLKITDEISWNVTFRYSVNIYAFHSKHKANARNIAFPIRKSHNTKYDFNFKPKFFFSPRNSPSLFDRYQNRMAVERIRFLSQINNISGPHVLVLAKYSTH